MAHEVPILQTTLKSTGDLSAKQFSLVKLDTANNESVVVCSANSDRVVGVVTNKPTAGQPATVMCYGITKVQAGGTITRGDPLMSDASGHAVTATGTNPSFALALSSSASGQLFDALILAGTNGTVYHYSVLSFQVDLASITGSQNVFTYTPGFAGTIVSCSFVVNVPVTTGAKAATLTPGVAGTPTTGGATALTSANCTPMGNEVKGSAITALNTFTAVQTITVASTAVTAFVEGTGTFLMTIYA